MQCTNLCKKYPFPPMSITSTATDLVAHNCIPHDEVELLNCMCVLVLTRGDGTPFDAGLHTGGGHHRPLHWVRTDTPQRCALVFSSWISSVISSHGWNAGHRCVGLSKLQLYAKSPLGFVWLVLLLSTWGHTYGWGIENFQAPSLQPQIGRRCPNHLLVTPTQMGGPHISFRWTLGMPSWGSLWRFSARR